jgi:calcineurin-like phosphoesterase family protein
MIWFSSDHHFGHRNIIKYLSRPFMTQEEKKEFEKAKTRYEVKKVRISNETIALHDDTLIDNINECVMPNDTLYHLGDFCMGSFEQVKKYRNRINCKNVYLIKGNHDKLRHSEYKRLFVKVKDLWTIKWQGQKIVLCHYPMLRWDCGHYGSWQLYGHCHGTLTSYLEEHDLTNLLSMDVGVDSHSYYPVSFEQIKGEMEKKDSPLTYE